MRWAEFLGDDVVEKYGDKNDAASFYGLKAFDDLTSPAGQKIRADCDMFGLITKDDAPVFLSVTRDAGPITDRGAYLHHPKHSKAIYDRCCEIGVPVVAEIPGLKITPPSGGPASLREFLLKYLLSSGGKL